MRVTKHIHIYTPNKKANRNKMKKKRKQKKKLKWKWKRKRKKGHYIRSCNFSTVDALDRSEWILCQKHQFRLSGIMNVCACVRSFVRMQACVCVCVWWEHQVRVQSSEMCSMEPKPNPNRNRENVNVNLMPFSRFNRMALRLGATGSCSLKKNCYMEIIACDTKVMCALSAQSKRYITYSHYFNVIYIYFRWGPFSKYRLYLFCNNFSFVDCGCVVLCCSCC